MDFKTYNKCCLESLKSGDVEKADLVITSPPYNMNLRIRNGKYCSRQIVKELTTKYKNFDDNMPMDDYFDFNVEVITELLKVAPLVFYNVQFLTGNKVALFKLIGHFAEELKEIIVWDKINAQPAIRDKVLNSQYEVVLVFDRENAMARRFDSAVFDRGTLSNLWRIPRGKKVSKSHGAVFPEAFADTIIENFSSEGQTILDPFMGTGTTGVVCLAKNRDFVGIELDKEYFDVSNQRLLEQKEKLSFFGLAI